MKIHHFNGIYQERLGFSWAMLVSGRVVSTKTILVPNSTTRNPSRYHNPSYAKHPHPNHPIRLACLFSGLEPSSMLLLSQHSDVSHLRWASSTVALHEQKLLIAAPLRQNAPWGRSLMITAHVCKNAPTQAITTWTYPGATPLAK